MKINVPSKNLNDIKKTLQKINCPSPIKQNNQEQQEQLSKKFNSRGSGISYSSSEDDNMKSQINNNPKPKLKQNLSLYNLKIIKELGSGAYGKVMLVEEKVVHKILALKTIKYKPNEEEKIKKEVEISRHLKHEKIVKCYATYFNDGTVNFVLNYMDKGSLSCVLEKAKIIPENIVGNITYQILEGLAYLQKERVIHRDLKPSNILLNARGEVKICDFGVSALVLDSWDPKNTMIGSFKYMSPQRIDKEEYYINADIWSLGIIVVECCLGYYPYIIYNNMKPIDNFWILKGFIDNKPPPTLGPEFSLDLRDFLNKCLVIKPTERQTAKQLLSHPFITKYKNSSNNELSLWLEKM